MKRLPGLIILTFALAQMAPAANWFVATNGTGGGTSWADATNSLQGAIVASSAGDTVWVSNGVYDVGGITNFPTGTVLTNRIAIYKAIIVQAFSTNPVDTVIKGAGPNGPAAVRCVWMTNGSTLIGFTLTNGATLTSGANVECGGGVSCQSTNTTISNCVLTGNSAGIYGGGVIFGTLFNCTIGVSNSAAYGGGAYASTLYNCTLISNSAGTDGGGAYSGTLTNCTLSYNSAVSYGGGARASTMYDCTIGVSNSATWGAGMAYATLSDCTIVSNSAPGGYGGGAYYGTLTNCTLIGNVAPSAGWGGGTYGSTQYNCTLSGNSAGQGGGGAYGGTLSNCILTNNSSSSGNGGGGAYGGTFYNCTLVGNESFYSAGNAGYGGGVSGGTLINCIVYSNSAPSGSNWYEVVAFTNTCTAPAATNGVGNISADPMFIANGSGYGTSHVEGNYRLRNISPPINAGTNFLYMADPTDVRSKDLDGSRRIDGFSRQVDMGCYELMLRGTMFLIGQ